MKSKPDFFRAILTLDALGMLKGTQELDRGIYVSGETIGWVGVAYELAKLLPGTFRPNVSGGVNWYNGSNGPHGVIVCWNSFKGVMASREVYRSMVPRQETDDAVWSTGAVARRLLSYCAEPMPYESTAERFISRHPYGYHECDPGVYDTPENPYIANPPRNLFDEPMPISNPRYSDAVTLYDVKSYYYHMLKRLSTLRIAVASDDTIQTFPMRPSERDKWKDLLDAVEENKPLRNTLCGAATGSLKWSVAYTSSRPNQRKDPEGYAKWKPGTVREVMFPGKPGVFRAAGLLVVATGAELCYTQALTADAIYATIDSVALRSGRPTVWESYGFTVNVKARGNADICHRGSYRIGQLQTVHYADGDREYYGSPRIPVPSLYAKQWL